LLAVDSTFAKELTPHRLLERGRLQDVMMQSTFLPISTNKNKKPKTKMLTEDRDACKSQEYRHVNKIEHGKFKYAYSNSTSR